MRKFIRHPSDIPIEIALERPTAHDNGALHDVSNGGLCFSSRDAYRVGAIIRIRIPVSRPVFETTGRVAWCNEKNGLFITGVEFLNQEDVYRMRMVEQVCYIEHYKNEVKLHEGRDLTSQEAALEWIAKSARDFPDTDER